MPLFLRWWGYWTNNEDAEPPDPGATTIHVRDLRTRTGRRFI